MPVRSFTSLRSASKSSSAKANSRRRIVSVVSSVWARVMGVPSEQLDAAFARIQAARIGSEVGRGCRQEQIEQRALRVRGQALPQLRAQLQPGLLAVQISGDGRVTECGEAVAHMRQLLHQPIVELQ